MNTNLVASLVIGGLLLMAIATMTLSINRSTTHLTMSQISQQRIGTVTDLLSFDIPKIGYERPTAPKEISEPFITAKKHELAFWSDIDNNGNVEDIIWRFSSPDLYRFVDGNKKEIAVGVHSLTFNYLDKNRNTLSTPVSDKSKIRYITVEVLVRSKEQLGKVNSTEGEYIYSTWKKTFTPKNLTF